MIKVLPKLKRSGYLASLCSLISISCSLTPEPSAESTVTPAATPATLPAPAATPATNSTVHTQLLDLVFAKPGGVELLLDLHLPKGKKPAPLVVYIHGGGWSTGNRKAHGMSWLTDYGYAVACIEYRMGREAPFPAQIHDCKGALRWLRAHQDVYGYDASKVVVAGMSAGGHLATLMGTTSGNQELEGTIAGHLDQDSEVQGIINYYGPSDFILRSNNQPDKTERRSGPVYQLLGGPVKQKQAMAKLASPVTHISPDDPPLLILHGSEDRQVLPDQSEHLFKRYQAAGLEAELHVQRGKGHGWQRTYQEQALLLRFLAKVLG